MLKQKLYKTLLFFMIFTVFSTPILALDTINRSFYGSVSMGLGYPQIPLSQFRPPVAVTGNIAMHCLFNDRWALQLGPNYMTSFSLGTVTGRKMTLKFDIAWINLDIQYRIFNDMNKKGHISLGTGAYRLDRQLDMTVDKVDTFGFCLGYINRLFYGKHSAVFEIRWHLLFKPDDNPQILTLTYGILL